MGLLSQKPGGGGSGGSVLTSLAPKAEAGQEEDPTTALAPHCPWLVDRILPGSHHHHHRGSSRLSTATTSNNVPRPGSMGHWLALWVHGSLSPDAGWAYGEKGCQSTLPGAHHASGQLTVSWSRTASAGVVGSAPHLVLQRRAQLCSPRHREAGEQAETRGRFFKLRLRQIY